MFTQCVYAKLLPIVPHEFSTVMFSLMNRLPFKITRKCKYARVPGNKYGNEVIVLSGRAVCT